MWAEVLNLAQIGVHDRFFDLGGDSLAATRCLAKIAQEFGAERFTRESSLYVPTLAEMAKALSDPAEWMGHGNEVLPLRSNELAVARTPSELLEFSLPADCFQIVFGLLLSFLCGLLGIGIRL